MAARDSWNVAGAQEVGGSFDSWTSHRSEGLASFADDSAEEEGEAGSTCDDGASAQSRPASSCSGGQRQDCSESNSTSTLQDSDEEDSPREVGKHDDNDDNEYSSDSVDEDQSLKSLEKQGSDSSGDTNAGVDSEGGAGAASSLEQCRSDDSAHARTMGRATVNFGGVHTRQISEDADVEDDDGADIKARPALPGSQSRPVGTASGSESSLQHGGRIRRCMSVAIGFLGKRCLCVDAVRAAFHRDRIICAPLLLLGGLLCLPCVGAYLCCSCRQRQRKLSTAGVDSVESSPEESVSPAGSVRSSGFSPAKSALSETPDDGCGAHTRSKLKRNNQFSTNKENRNASVIKQVKRSTRCQSPNRSPGSSPITSSRSSPRRSPGGSRWSAHDLRRSAHERTSPRSTRTPKTGLGEKVFSGKGRERWLHAWLPTRWPGYYTKWRERRKRYLEKVSESVAEVVDEEDQDWDNCDENGNPGKVRHIVPTSWRRKWRYFVIVYWSPILELLELIPWLLKLVKVFLRLLPLFAFLASLGWLGHSIWTNLQYLEDKCVVERLPPTFNTVGKMNPVVSARYTVSRHVPGDDTRIGHRITQECIVEVPCLGMDYGDTNLYDDDRCVTFESWAWGDPIACFYNNEDGDGTKNLELFCLHLPSKLEKETFTTAIAGVVLVASCLLTAISIYRSRDLLRQSKRAGAEAEAEEKEIAEAKRIIAERELEEAKRHARETTVDGGSEAGESDNRTVVSAVSYGW